MIKKFLKVVKDNNIIQKGDRIGVAVSGGADSMALVLLLNEIKENMGFSLCILHINHNIRGKESDSDEEYVKDFAKKNNIQIEVKSVNAVGYAKENKLTLEQSARILRYDAMYEIMREKNLNKLALAHHKMDQAETVLMHICRGCGLDGLIGMEYVAGQLIRPLLDFSKDEIVAYLKENNVSWREDSTNSDNAYARNYIRNEIMPRLQQVYPTAVNNIVRLSKKVQREVNFLDNQIKKEWFENLSNGIIIKNQAFETPEELQERVIKKALNKLGLAVDVFEVHYTAIIKLMRGIVGKKLNLPNNLIAHKDYKGLILYQETSCDLEEREFIANDDFCLADKNIKTIISKSKNLKSGELMADVDKIPVGAIWRRIKTGDKFTKYGGGTKKLSDYLTNKKIGSIERKNLVVLAKDNKILAIAGVEISDDVKVDDNTREVVKICLKK